MTGSQWVGLALLAIPLVGGVLWFVHSVCDGDWLEFFEAVGFTAAFVAACCAITTGIYLITGAFTL